MKNIEDFYKKYSNSIIKINIKDQSRFSDMVNDIIFTLDNYTMFPEIKTCGLIGKSKNFEIIIPKYHKDREEFKLNELIGDINSIISKNS